MPIALPFAHTRRIKHRALNEPRHSRGRCCVAAGVASYTLVELRELWRFPTSAMLRSRPSASLCGRRKEETRVSGRCAMVACGEAGVLLRRPSCVLRRPACCKDVRISFAPQQWRYVQPNAGATEHHTSAWRIHLIRTQERLQESIDPLADEGRWKDGGAQSSERLSTVCPPSVQRPSNVLPASFSTAGKTACCGSH